MPIKKKMCEHDRMLALYGKDATPESRKRALEQTDKDCPIQKLHNFSALYGGNIKEN